MTHIRMHMHTHAYTQTNVTEVYQGLGFNFSVLSEIKLSVVN